MVSLPRVGSFQLEFKRDFPHAAPRGCDHFTQNRIQPHVRTFEGRGQLADTLQCPEVIPFDRAPPFPLLDWRLRILTQEAHIPQAGLEEELEFTS